ncbi:competence/damage-inducible protein A [Gudongella sp. DL1XJH-153]|uniref:competence/damage-inducible protein A n=1 Tax=Gudongella sp. DL1XJH-153 TaxID=3409804 RepID=UPI003BB650C6
MKAEIITIGTEIMLGSILNTNVTYLSRRLMELGIETIYHTSVDDDYDRLEKSIRLAMDRVDVILTTGGLGPTDDDLTKEALSNVTVKKMISDVDMEHHIKQYFAYSKREMTSNNLKQAMKPEGSEFIKNPKGTAPGIYMKWNNKKIIMMPGPPREMKSMFEESVVNLIKDDHIIIVKSINTSGLGESTLETQLKELDLSYPNFTITTYAGSGSVEIKVIGRGKDVSKLESESEKIIETIKARIGKHIYGYNNSSLEKVIIDTLNQNKMKISVCESVTGGSISKRLTSVPGASLSFDRGLVTYSNQSKIDELGVLSSSLDEYGAVSSRVACEMAKGLLNKTNSDIVISTTGYAGPDKNENITTGLVYVCVMSCDAHTVFERIFSGDRDTIQERTTNFALWNGFQFLNNKLTSSSR